MIQTEQKKAFTLIELMVVISIMVIMSVTMYTPYSVYQTKQKVKNSAKIVSQTLSESRNMAINGIGNIDENLSIGVHFVSGEEDIDIYGYPISDGEIAPANLSKTEYFIKSIPLIQGVELLPLTGAKNEGLFFFSSISGEGTYYIGGVEDPDSKNIKIGIGYKGIESGMLSKRINYYTQTYISD